MRPAETIVWAAGEQSFRLDIGALRALEQRCDAGCAVILMRLLGQAWKIDDVVQVLRLGLIGAGTAEKDAQAIVDKALETVSPFALAVTSAEVLRRFIMWESDDQPGEAPAGTARKAEPRSPTEKPDGHPTSAPEPQ